MRVTRSLLPPVLLSILAIWCFLSARAAPQGTAIPVSIIVAPSDEEARKLLDRLQHGGDFAALAKANSVDPSAADGGYLGTVDPANLRPELRQAVERIAPGQLSGIVRIPSGYAILKVLSGIPQPETLKDPVKQQALAGAGAVRLTYDFSGFASALTAVGRFSKSEGWDRDMRQACEVRTRSVAAALEQVTALLARPGLPPATLRDVNSLVGDLHAYRGDTDDAIRYATAAYELAQANSPDRAPQLEEALAIAYLHRAGGSLYQNFALGYPLRAAAVGESQKQDLQHALELFLRYLKRDPGDGEVRWLLNLAYMLAGRYPAGVPKEFLIAPAALESQESIGRFVDVAHAAGVNRRGQAGGVIVDDFDNDGIFDIAISSVNDCEPLAFYHGNGDGTFSNRAVEAGLAGVTGGLNIVQTDYNNDGCKDILVLRGGWEYARPKTLLRNNCDGTFTDVTREAGLQNDITATQTAVWVDIDNDGRLDLFVGNESAPAQLYRNQGDGTFVDIARRAGVASLGFVKSVVAADYDGDGYPDLYVSSFNGDHHLFHNNRDLTFTDVTREAGVEGPWSSFGAWFFDFDNDGWPDLFVADYGSSVDEVMRGYRKEPQSGEKLRLFRNLGNGKFEDVTAQTGLGRVMMPMGLNFGDLDNDGYLDFYLGSGNPSYASLIPNALFHNQGGKKFVDITASSGTGILPKGHGVAFADLDGDGDEDVIAVMGGAVPGDRQMTRIFENPGHGNDWLGVCLVGRKSNRAAIGARIRVTVENAASSGNVSVRDVYRTVGSGGSFGASPLEQHVGLGKAARIRNLEIWWPASGTRQNFSGVAPNQVIEIQESAKDYRKIERRTVRLGGPSRAAGRM
jgi:tetratricopeptide (TPR) repeat protein